MAVSPSVPIIEVKGLWKRYGMPLPKFFHKAANLFSRASERTDTLPWALRDINFSLLPGENLGIIGRNGAGKSTLLKILAGVSPPTLGSCHTRGRIFPMIELQAGINPDLTGRENIMLLGAVAGFSAKEVRSRYDAIAAFAELGDWLERPVRMYSSGMQARLAFSVAIHADADLLLIDEVLSVGDYRFQKKCIDHLERLRLSRQTSIIFVSHNPYQVQRLCDKVLMLESGTQKHMAEASKTLELYHGYDTEGDNDSSEITLPPYNTREGSGRLRISKVELLDEAGSLVPALSTGEAATLRLHYIAKGEAEKTNVGIRIFDSQNLCVLSLALTRFMDREPMSGIGYFDCHIERFPLLQGSYSLQIKAAGHEIYDLVQSAHGLKVKSSTNVRTDTAELGLVYAPAHWSISKLNSSVNNSVTENKNDTTLTELITHEKIQGK